MQPVEDEMTHPTMRGEVKGPKPLRFTRLRCMELENAVMDSTQISNFIETHRRTLIDFNFEDVKLREGSWDDALQPLTIITGSDRWKKTQEEVMDVPIMLSPIEAEPRIMGPLLEEVDAAIEDASKDRNGHTLSRWLSKPNQKLKKSPAIGSPSHNKKDSFFDADHMKRFLRISSWK